MSNSMDLDQWKSEIVGRLENRLWLLFHDREKLEIIIREGLVRGAASDIDRKLEFWKNDFLSYDLFCAIIFDEAVGGELKTTNFVWKRLIDAGVFVRVFQDDWNMFFQFQTQLEKLYEYLSSDTFVNIFNPASSLYGRYKNAIVSIDVKKHGDLHRGSGFVARMESNRRFWIVTCKHNIDENAGIRIFEIRDAAGLILKIGKPVFSEKFDVAFIPIFEPIASPVFYLKNKIEIFDDVYTLGFPRVPQADAPMLGHRGEVNGFVKLYTQNCDAIVISNLVSPGSSGCPVLNADGRCVGMTINWLEGEWTNDQQNAPITGSNVSKSERARFSAALSSQDITEAFCEIRTTRS